MKSRAVAFCALLFAILCSSWSAVSLKAGNEINSTHFTATGLAATDKVKIEGRTTDKHPETTKQPISSQNNASKTTYETILTPAFAITCEMKNVSCAKCLEDSDWKICENQRSCAAKTGRFIPSGCKENGWYSKQCKIRGKILIIVLPTVGGVFVAMFFCCAYYCCCHRYCQTKSPRNLVPRFFPRCSCRFKICCTDDTAVPETPVLSNDEYPANGEHPNDESSTSSNYGSSTPSNAILSTPLNDESSPSNATTSTPSIDESSTPSNAGNEGKWEMKALVAEDNEGFVSDFYT